MGLRKTSLKALLRLGKRKFTFSKGSAAKLGFGVGATAAGASIGAGAAPAGLKGEGAKLGALEGAVLGAAGVLAPTAGKVFFRRIRGRIIPIRRKA